jgi:hypothetical protein
MANVPYMDTVTLTSHSIVYNLHSLLAAVTSDLPRPAQALNLQADIAGGAAKIFIGDQKLKTNANSYGACLEAGWSLGLDSMGANLIHLPDIYLMSDTDGALLHVIVVTR